MKTLTPLLTALLLANATAVEIYYTSSIAGGHLSSTGAALGNDTIAELGAFNLGFTPTAANVSQWQTNWVPASRSAYNASVGFFSGTHTITSNAGAFATTRQGWVWIYNRSGQWALYSHNTWTWPSAAATNILATPQEWAIENATINLVGSTNTGVAELTTAAMPSASGPQLTFSDYMSTLFGSDSTDITPQGDEDGDGQSNFAEYAFGSRPDDASSTTSNHSTTHSLGGQNYLAVSVEKGWTTGITYTAQMSTDLGAWSSNEVIVEQNDAQTYTARDNHPIGARAKCFLRLTAQ